MAAASALTHAFQKFFLQVLRTIFFPSHWLLSHIGIVETMVSDERLSSFLGKHIGRARGSNQRPPVHKSSTLPTELWDSASTKSEPLLIKQLIPVNVLVSSLYSTRKGIICHGNNKNSIKCQCRTLKNVSFWKLLFFDVYFFHY